MKLYEPFGGLRQLCGHPFVHLCFGVIGYFMVTFKYRDFKDGEIVGLGLDVRNAYKYLIITHFTIFITSAISTFYLSDAPNPSFKHLGTVEDCKERHSDSTQTKNIFAKFLDTFSVFAYTFTIFYAQIVVFRRMQD